MQVKIPFFFDKITRTLFLAHNAVGHHTDKFDIVTEYNVPVWRRGQTALITITTTQPFNYKTHRMRITFDFGNFNLS